MSCSQKHPLGLMMSWLEHESDTNCNYSQQAGGGGFSTIPVPVVFLHLVYGKILLISVKPWRCRMSVSRTYSKVLVTDVENDAACSQPAASSDRFLETKWADVKTTDIIRFLRLKMMFTHEDGRESVFTSLPSSCDTPIWQPASGHQWAASLS